MFYNNCYIFAALLVLVGSYPISEAASENKNILTLGERVIKVLEKKCADTAGETVYNNIKSDLELFKNDCFNLYIGAEQITDENLTTELCQNQNEKFLQCLATFTEKIDPCLGPKEKDVKQFILDNFKDGAKYFCDQIKILNDNKPLKTATAKCINTLKEHPEINPNRVCFADFTTIGDNPTEKTISKQNLCYDVMQNGLCFYGLLKEHCPGSIEVIGIQQGLTDIATEKCVPILHRGTHVPTVEPPTTPTSTTK